VTWNVFSHVSNGGLDDPSQLQWLDQTPDGTVAQFVPESWTVLLDQVQFTHQRVPVLLIRGIQLWHVFYQALPSWEEFWSGERGPEWSGEGADRLVSRLRRGTGLPPPPTYIFKS